MNAYAIAFLVVTTIALVVLPRRWAPIPLIIGVCYLPPGQNIDIGPYTFTPVRILVVAGLARLLSRREWSGQRPNGLDGLMLAWGIWMVLSVYFHVDPSTQVVNRLGLLLDGWGSYFLLRAFCRSRGELSLLFRIVAVLLAPIATAMVVEKLTVHNPFAIFGDVPAIPEIRDGSVRAQGPFAHSILAGSIGAVSLPLMIGLWPLHRRIAVLGVIACVAMVMASSSSGPIVSALLAVFALCWWPYRHRMRLARYAAVVAYCLLALVMNSPPYYLIARIDLAGGSTGWHRARLIESSIEHLGEWWLIGTDYTRHWMPTGVSFSPDHTDITNHYLLLGVLGGLPLMGLFILMLWKGFSYVGRALQEPAVPAHSQFLTWAAGTALFAHAATCISSSVHRSINRVPLSNSCGCECGAIGCRRGLDT